MKKTKLTAIILSTVIILGIMTSAGVSAETTYNKISTMKNVSYELNNDITKHEIGDINTLVYVDDTGRISLTGNKDLLGNIDESKLDTLYYIDKNGKVVTVDSVNDIKYTNEKGYTYSTGDGPGNKSSKVTESSGESATSSANTLTNSTTKTGWVKDGNELTYVYSNGQKCYGWFKEGDNWYYFGERNGYMVKDQQLEIDGKVYVFDSNGNVVTNAKTMEDTKKTGWIKYGGYAAGGGWEYIDSNHEKHVGWLQDGSYWYYFNKRGIALINEMRKIDGRIYSFDSNGRMEVNVSRYNYYTERDLNHTGPTDGSGLLDATSKLYISIDANGVCTLTDDYYDKIGVSTTNVLCGKRGYADINGNNCTELFDKNGDQVFGWYNEPIYTWNADSKNFSTIHRWTYYDENGFEVIGTSKVIDGTTYSFDSDGYLI